jgi:hypothetical protein
MEQNIIIAIVVIVLIAIILLVILNSQPEKILEISVTPISQFAYDSDVNQYRQTQFLLKLLDLCSKYGIKFTKTQSNMSYITIATTKGFKTIPLYEMTFVNDYMKALNYIGALTDPKYAVEVNLNNPPVKKEAIQQLLQPVEPAKLSEVSYNLVSKFFKFPLYNDNNQMVLEKELIRLCGIANIKPVQTDTLKSEIKVTTTKGESKVFSLASNYIEGFAECFLYMNQFLQDKYPMKGTDVNIQQVSYSPAVANVPIVIELVKELSKPEGRSVYRGTLKLKILGRSNMSEYIKPQPKSENFINFLLKIDEQIFAKDTDISEIANIPFSDVKGKIINNDVEKATNMFDSKHQATKELQTVDANGYPIPMDTMPVMNTAAPAPVEAPAATATSNSVQGMNAFKETSRNYR